MEIDHPILRLFLLTVSLLNMLNMFPMRILNSNHYHEIIVFNSLPVRNSVKDGWRTSKTKDAVSQLKGMPDLAPGPEMMGLGGPPGLGFRV